MRKLIVLDILDHPTFSLAEDYRTILDRTLSRKTSVEFVNPLLEGGLRPFWSLDFDAILVSGSVTSFDSAAGWIADLAELIRRIIAANVTPALVICMAHELVAHMYGGKVVRNSAGSELGTVRFDLTEDGLADPLFAGFARTFYMQSAHSHDVIAVTEEVTVLAYNERSPCQALRVGPLWGVQFHADLSAARLAEWIRCHADLERMVQQNLIERADDLAPFLNTLWETAERETLFRNFARIADM